MHRSIAAPRVIGSLAECQAVGVKAHTDAPNPDVAEAWSEAMKAMAARDRFAHELESASQKLQEMTEKMHTLEGHLMEAREMEAGKVVQVGEMDQKEEIAKLKRDVQVAKRRFEKEEKLAAEHGADIEDLKERLQALQTASNSFGLEASDAELCEKRLNPSQTTPALHLSLLSPLSPVTVHDLGSCTTHLGLAMSRTRASLTACCTIPLYPHRTSFAGKAVTRHG